VIFSYVTGDGVTLTLPPVNLNANTYRLKVATFGAVLGGGTLNDIRFYGIPYDTQARNIITAGATGTSITATAASVGTFYNITNSQLNTLTVPGGDPPVTSGSFWVFRNNTSAYISILKANGTGTKVGIPDPLVIPPSNSTTLAWTGGATGAGGTYVLY